MPFLRFALVLGVISLAACSGFESHEDIEVSVQPPEEVIDLTIDQPSQDDIYDDRIALPSATVTAQPAPSLPQPSYTPKAPSSTSSHHSGVRVNDHVTIFPLDDSYDWLKSGAQ